MEFYTFHQDLVWLSCFGSPDSGTTVSLQDFSRTLNCCFIGSIGEAHRMIVVQHSARWKINQAQVKPLTDQLRRLRPCPQADCTTSLAPEPGKIPLHRTQSGCFWFLLLPAALKLVPATAKGWTCHQEQPVDQNAGRSMKCTWWSD